MSALLSSRLPVAPAPWSRIAQLGCRRHARRPQGRPRLLARAAPKVVCIAAEEEATAAKPEASTKPLATVPVTFAVFLPVAFGEHLRVVGSHEALGGWEVGRAPALEWSEGHVWTATLDLPAGEEMEYKFVIVKHCGAPWWEATPNRTLAVSGPQALSTQWNNPMAEYEARAIEVQGAAALELLESPFSSPPAPTAPTEAAPEDIPGQAAPAAAAQPAAAPAAPAAAAAAVAAVELAPTPGSVRFQQQAAATGGAVTADVPVAAALAAPAPVPGGAAAEVEVEVLPAEARAESAPTATANNGSASLLKTVGKTAGYVAMGVAAGALMSAFAVDMVEMAAVGAVVAVAGSAALSDGPAAGRAKGAAGKGEEGEEEQDAAEGEAEGESSGPSRRAKDIEPGVLMAAAVLSALDTTVLALNSVISSASSVDENDEGEEEAEEEA